MLGCIGVAPPGEEVWTSGPASNHGGNMDYNDIVEGATVFFPFTIPAPISTSATATRCKAMVKALARESRLRSTFNSR